VLPFSATPHVHQWCYFMLQIAICIRLRVGPSSRICLVVILQSRTIHVHHPHTFAYHPAIFILVLNLLRDPSPLYPHRSVTPIILVILFVCALAYRLSSLTLMTMDTLPLAHRLSEKRKLQHQTPGSFPRRTLSPTCTGSNGCGAEAEY
jgi:hypothetical protein